MCAFGMPSGPSRGGAPERGSIGREPTLPKWGRDTASTFGRCKCIQSTRERTFAKCTHYERGVSQRLLDRALESLQRPVDNARVSEWVAGSLSKR